MMRSLITDGVCANCGKRIRETSEWNWTHSPGRYRCHDQDITNRDYAHPDVKTIQRVHELRRNQ